MSTADKLPKCCAREIACCSLLILLLLPLSLSAEERSSAGSVDAASSVSAANPESADFLPSSEISVMDPSRNYLSGKLESWARSLDGFFGDYRNYQESNNSIIQLDATTVLGDQGGPSYDQTLKLKIRLPNTQNRVKFLIETNPDERALSIPTKMQPSSITKPSTPASIAAALRYEKAEAERWHFSTDGGIKFAGLDSTPFVRARLSLAMPLGNWRFNVAETVFWFNTTGSGQSTLVDFERPLGKALLFRASSNATWLNDNRNFDLSQSFSIFHIWDERTAVLYQASVVGVSAPQAQVTDYVILMTYRYRLHREWVFLEISPQIHFPQVLEYHINPLLSLSLKILLDTSR